ncbi:MAG: hypothetical protein ACPGSD_09670 [Flavobacteriales bacterium]
MKKSLSIFLVFVLFACNEEKPTKYNLIYHFVKPFEKKMYGNQLPRGFSQYANYIEFDKGDCSNTFFVPDIFYERMDLNEKVNIGLPVSSVGKLQNKFGTLSIVNTKTAYELESIEIDELLIKKAKPFNGEINYQLNAIRIVENATPKNVEKVREKMKKMLCNGASEIHFYIENDIKSPKPPKPKGPETPEPVVLTLPPITDNDTISKGSLDTKYAHYSGGIENGKMHGKGSLTFTKDAAIPVSRLSTEQPSAKKGQKVVGIFNNGNFESGDLFDKNGKKIKAIFIGK